MGENTIHLPCLCTWSHSQFRTQGGGISCVCTWSHSSFCTQRDVYPANTPDPTLVFVHSGRRCTDMVCIPLLTKTRVRSGAQAGYASPPSKTWSEIRCIGRVCISHLILRKPLKYTTSKAPTALMLHHKPEITLLWYLV
jgi:hypothetical protein